MEEDHRLIFCCYSIELIEQGCLERVVFRREDAKKTAKVAKEYPSLGSLRSLRNLGDLAVNAFITWMNNFRAYTLSYKTSL